jgi:signal transduction histidine kinase
VTEPAAAAPWALRLVTSAVMLALFLLDALTSADNVSLCFAYAIPIFLALLDAKEMAFVYAGVATLLSVAGSFIQPPGDSILLIFVANRVIAVVTQWMVAALVFYRHRADALLRVQLERERQDAARQRRFLAILSHEVNTPLTIIDGQAYRLAKLRHDISADELATRTAKMRQAVRRIGAMVRKIQLASQVGEGALPMDYHAIDLAALLAESVEHAGEAAEAGGITVTLQAGPLPTDFWGDASLLRQVLDNLLSNAVKFSPAGSTVALSARRMDEAVVIEVADRGLGIAAEDRPLLFTPYHRGSNSKGVPGAGIGLYLSRNLVEMHGGEIAADPREGGGTVIIVRLPLRTPPPPQKDGP